MGRQPSKYWRGELSVVSWDLLPSFGGDGFGGDEGVEEAIVLFFGEGAVDVVGGALVVSGGEIDLVHVDGGGIDDGRDGVVEGEVVGAGEALELGGQRGAGEWAAGEYGEGVGVVFFQVRDFFAMDFDPGFGGDAGCDAFGELYAIDGERVASGDGGSVGFGEEDAACSAHLLL